MKTVFIIQHNSGTLKRILKRIGAEKDRNTLGFIVEFYEYSFKLNKFKKPTIKKFEFFGEALACVGYKKEEV